ncbi:BEN domain-containing protein 5-like [Dermacentor silvarum]|uniref:BEN domain-containing protein 5-like n=1 Tax=Dermacentor silvarum TaxID=543639 RepID=UPI002101B2EC|nr:BEN domain-containing protein 5-like [Dermacentor silvarum]
MCYFDNVGMDIFSFQFHLAEGIVISANQAAKILNNKKATLVCKDTVQAIWGTDVLVNRSVSGVAAPKLRAAGELPKQPLTPTKLNVVTATVRYWGQLKGEDVTTAVASITKLLSEKIQDVRKSSKRLALAKENHSM